MQSAMSFNMTDGRGTAVCWYIAEMNNDNRLLVKNALLLTHIWCLLAIPNRPWHEPLDLMVSACLDSVPDFTHRLKRYLENKARKGVVVP